MTEDMALAVTGIVDQMESDESLDQPYDRSGGMLETWTREGG